VRTATAEMTAPARRGLLTSLLESPALCGWIVGAGAIHVALAATPLRGWPCPFREATGWPCPGCGLGRACVLLLRGDFAEAMRLHAFTGPLLFVLLALVAGALPWAGRGQMRAVIRHVEERTWLVPAMLAALLIYWLARFALDADGWRALVV
jgi:hypothetical protein